MNWKAPSLLTCRAFCLTNTKTLSPQGRDFPGTVKPHRKSCSTHERNMAFLIHCVTSDFCEAFASCFIAFWSNSHMGWIRSVCVRVYVYSVVSHEAQGKMFVCCYTFLFSQRIVPGAVKRFAVILFPQECSGAGFVCEASEKLGSDPRMRVLHQYVCCCSSTTWNPRKTV